MLEVFTLATKLFDEQVARELEAAESDTAGVVVTVVDALQRVCEEAENAKLELAMIAETQKKMKETHINDVNNLREEREKVFFV